MGRTAGWLRQRRRQIIDPNTKLGRNGHLPMAAASELHHHLLVRLQGGSLHWGDRLPQRHRHRRSGRHPHPCGCRWHRHHRQRDRLLGRRVWVLHQSAPQRHLRNLYAHCSSICVVAGQEVKQGEVIGYVGTTGNSTGNHLHFEVWQNGQRTDALSFFRAKG